MVAPIATDAELAQAYQQGYQDGRKSMQDQQGDMTMTKKDYIAIAAALSRARLTRPDQATSECMAVASAYHEIVGELATVCERDNPRFDRARFLAACGVQS